MSHRVTCEAHAILSSIHKASGPLFLLPTDRSTEVAQDIRHSLISCEFLPTSTTGRPSTFACAHGTTHDTVNLGLGAKPTVERDVETSVRLVARDEPAERGEQVANGHYGSNYTSLPGQFAKGELHPYYLLEAISADSDNLAPEAPTAASVSGDTEPATSSPADNETRNESTQHDRHTSPEPEVLQRWTVFMPRSGMIDTITNATLPDVARLRQENIDTIDNASFDYTRSRAETLCPDAIQNMVQQQGLLFQLEQTRRLVHDQHTDEAGRPAGAVGGSGVEMGYACPVVSADATFRQAQEGSDVSQRGTRYDVGRGKWVEVDFQFEIRTRDPLSSTSDSTTA